MTNEQLAKYKKAYGQVFKINVPNADDKGDEVIPGGKKVFSGYFKKIGRQTMSFASKMSNGGQDFIKFIESLVEACWLEGDKEIKENDDLFYAAGNKLNETIKNVEADMEEL